MVTVIADGGLEARGSGLEDKFERWEFLFIPNLLPLASNL
jgi:hypothetical protein